MKSEMGKKVTTLAEIRRQTVEESDVDHLSLTFFQEFEVDRALLKTGDSCRLEDRKTSLDLKNCLRTPFVSISPTIRWTR